ncbi:MAG: LptE family protein [Flavobacteriales bacterium]|nr:LptE family protein [Flavobacteriales bacterium]
MLLPVVGCQLSGALGGAPHPHGRKRDNRQRTIDNRSPYLLTSLLALSIALSSCHIHYGTSGGEVPAGAKTISVQLFDARAPLCTPQSAQTFTETLRDLLQAQTPLNLTRTDGDLQYEGAIIAYDVQPVAIQANESAALNRLTISVTVHYTNTLEPKKSADINASRFADYNSSQDLGSVETQLVENIGKQLAQDIFDKTLGNW